MNPFTPLKFYWPILACLFFVFGIACKKGPGEGGSATIHGKVKTYDYNGNYPVLDSIYYQPDENVYIIYGDGDTYNDNYKTSYDGSYEFRYLRKGTYKIFVYSDDSTGLSPTGLVTVIKQVEVNSTKSTVEVPDLVIVKN